MGQDEKGLAVDSGLKQPGLSDSPLALNLKFSLYVTRHLASYSAFVNEKSVIGISPRSFISWISISGFLPSVVR